MVKVVVLSLGELARVDAGTGGGGRHQASVAVRAAQLGAVWPGTAGRPAHSHPATSRMC